jgi:DNA recombination protein RmuC
MPVTLIATAAGAAALGFILAWLWQTRRLHSLKIQLAVATEKSARVPELESRLLEKSDRLDALQREHAALQTRLEQERERMAEKLELMREAEARLSERFENLANRIFEEKSRLFAERGQTQMDGLLSPLREQLGEFKRRVDEIHVDDARDRASLRQEIKTLQEQSRHIEQEAVNLTRALKGDKKAQGNWGEMILERVLERSGLRKGVEYETQESLRDAEQKLFRPDVVVHLPEGKHIVIDSKVSLVAYERYTALESDEEREAALRAHLKAVREHVKTLGRKDYAGLAGLNSPDFVLMFTPIEAALLLAFQHDDALFDDAFAERVVIVAPTTLLATLRTIDNVWRHERQNENAKALVAKASAMHEKFRGFLVDMEKLGQQLGGVHKTYEAAMNKLAQGRGNLVSLASGFEELGVKIAKPLPKETLERAGLDAGRDRDAETE